MSTPGGSETRKNGYYWVRNNNDWRIEYCPQQSDEFDEIDWRPIVRAAADTEALTLEQYCNLIGADPDHAIAFTIWKTLEIHGYKIVKP